MTCSQRDTWAKPSQQPVTDDRRYGAVSVTAWHGMHPKLAGRGRWAAEDAPPIVKGRTIRVEVDHLPKPTARTNKALWLFWSGEGTLDLDVWWRSCFRRFDIELAFRLAKSTLGRTSPSLGKPAQAERWTWLSVAIPTRLRLARGHVDDIRLPWQHLRGPHQLTPGWVRRESRRVRVAICTTASPPKSTKADPRRSRGTRRSPRTRDPAVEKAA